MLPAIRWHARFFSFILFFFFFFFFFSSSPCRYRIELTGTLVNSYNTNLGHMKSAFEVDYWIGGLVTGGLPLQMLATSGWTADPIPENFQQRRPDTPNPKPSGGNVTAYVARAKWWLDRYRHFGHVAEDGATTLHLDEQCCHVQGVCEWVACNDTVFATLTGGTSSFANRTFGLYVGSPAAVTTPAMPDNSMLLLFQSIAVGGVTVTVGSPADTRITVVLHSPASSTGIAMSGGFWSGRAAGVEETVSSPDGKVISRKTVSAASGAYTFRPSNPAIPGETVAFAKTQGGT